VALSTGVQHFVVLCLPGSLIQAGDIGGLDHVRQLSRLSSGIKNTQTLQDGRLVGVPLLFSISLPCRSLRHQFEFWDWIADLDSNLLQL
jgi:hypothetical protein